jgi:hypothetical protein
MNHTNKDDDDGIHKRRWGNKTGKDFAVQV